MTYIESNDVSYTIDVNSEIRYNIRVINYIITSFQ